MSITEHITTGETELTDYTGNTLTLTTTTITHNHVRLTTRQWETLAKLEAKPFYHLHPAWLVGTRGLTERHLQNLHRAGLAFWLDPNTSAITPTGQAALAAREASMQRAG